MHQSAGVGPRRCKDFRTVLRRKATQPAATGRRTATLASPALAIRPAGSPNAMPARPFRGRHALDSISAHCRRPPLVTEAWQTTNQALRSRRPLTPCGAASYTAKRDSYETRPARSQAGKASLARNHPAYWPADFSPQTQSSHAQRTETRVIRSSQQPCRARDQPPEAAPQ